MIYGIGTDLIEIKRIKDNYNEKFIKRILTTNEIDILNSFKSEKRKIEFLAGRFAAKEAFSKAIGTGIGDISFLDIEIVSKKGKPICEYLDYKIHLTISHTIDYAVAFVVLEN
ncbi:holo-ACP synthase [Mycoplasmatota bacterium zrk1]